MNLAAQTGAFMVWGARVMRVFVMMRPGTTVGVIAATAAASITRLLSFFLPLKVILLAASSGVPRYFPFIDAADKNPWIIGLAIGSFVAYGSTLLLDSLVKRWSAGASANVLEGANEIAIQSDQQERVQRAYSGFCNASANLLFVLIGSSVLLLLNQSLIAVVFVLSLLQFFFSFWVLRGEDDHLQIGGVKRWLMESPETYLDVLGSITFLLGFLVILAPYVFGGGANLLLAILSFLLLRRTISAGQEFTGTAVQLSRRREQTDALVFPHAQHLSKEPPYQRYLRDVFSKPGRQELASRALHEVVRDPITVSAEWMDAPKNFVQTLRIDAKPPNDVLDEQYLQMQIYRAARRMHLENEHFLFRHVSPGDLYAPKRFGSWKLDPFEYQLVEYGEGRPMRREEWKRHKGTLLRAMFCCEPPSRLIQAYKRSHRLLPERLLDDRLVERIRVAVDTDEEAAVLRDFGETGRYKLASELGYLPLTLDNPDLGPPACTVTAADKPLAVIWGRWTLEPFGAGKLMQREQLDLASWLPQLAEGRAALGAEDVTLERLELARLCCELEFADRQEKFKAALDVLKKLQIAVQKAADEKPPQESPAP